MKTLFLFSICMYFFFALSTKQINVEKNAFGQPVKKMPCLLRMIKSKKLKKSTNEIMQYDSEKKIIGSSDDLTFLYDQQKRLSEILTSGTSIQLCMAMIIKLLKPFKKMTRKH